MSANVSTNSGYVCTSASFGSNAGCFTRFTWSNGGGVAVSADRLGVSVTCQMSFRGDEVDRFMDVIDLADIIHKNLEAGATDEAAKAMIRDIERSEEE